ncbi:MAG: hypothetical protein PHE83_07490 [Opitutaceae bacterium]|nr:hypothetical protein [Opitutaceae bacterium]
MAATTARATDGRLSLLPQYEQVSSALCADDLVTASAAARSLAAEAVRLHQATIANSAQAIAKADDLVTARNAFKLLSREAVALARRQKGYFILHCVMADAEWVQSTRKVANPYFGSDMPACGTIQEETQG